MNKNKTYDIINTILQNIDENNIEHLNNYIQNYNNSVNIIPNNIEEKNNTLINNPIKDFFDYHNIYYNKTSNIFYNYLKNNFIVMNEDNILYLLSEYMITNCDYIYKFNDKITIKNKLLKNIKENSIYEAIPDTETIQNVLHYLCPTIFREKKYCKIFLILLGSIIINKKIDNNFIIFTRIQIKSFLEEINKIISIYFCNTNILNYFKFKYTTDHNDITQRKLILSCNNINYDKLKNNEQFYINLILVSFYYFNRYENVDNYITSENIINININKLSNKNTKTDIINEFINSFIVKGGEQSISEKEIIILWKKFIYDKDLFINIFTSYSDFLLLLFNILNNSYDKHKTNNILCGYYSLETPTINIFKNFWEENFYYCENEYFFEINEILYLFNKYNNKKNNLNEKMIQIIIQNYYTNLNIIDNKFINNIKCKVWDKKKEIDTFIIKNNININDNFNDIYKKYNNYNSKHYKISKTYFNKYINNYNI